MSASSATERARRRSPFARGRAFADGGLPRCGALLPLAVAAVSA